MPEAAPQGTATPVKETRTRLAGDLVKVDLQLPDFEFYIDPHTMEVVQIPKEDLRELHQEMARLHDLAVEALAAKEAYLLALDEVETAAKLKAAHPDAIARIKARLDAAVAKMKKAEEKQRLEVKAIGPTLDGDGSRMMELIPLNRSVTVNEKGQTHKFQNGAMFTYVRSHRRRDHWRRYKLDPSAEGASQSKSFLAKDGEGRYKIDTELLKTQLKGLKVEAKARPFWSVGGSHRVNDALKWAATFNQDDKSRHVDLTASAQLLRWTLGASAHHSGLNDLRKGKVSARVNGRAEFALAEGKASGAFHFPHVSGWMLKYTWTDPQGSGTHTFDMGAVRFSLELSLSGSVGVSLVVEAGIEVNLKKDGKTQTLKGSPGQVGDDLALSMDVANGQVETRGKRRLEAKADLEAFAGAKAGLDLAGSLQWRKPQSTDFETFAKVGPGVDAQAGIAGGLYLDIHFAGGKFLFKARASVCLGLGAKGRLNLEVDYHLIPEFALWFYHQLRHCDYRMLKHMQKEAFEALCHLHYLALAGGIRLVEALADTPETLQKKAFAWARKQDNLLRLARNVHDDPERLLAAPPEAQGLILHQLTHEGFWGHVFSPDEVLEARRRAVMQVLRAIFTRRHYENLLQHMTPEVGRKMAWQAAEDQLWAFFATPLDRAEELAAGRRAPRAAAKLSDRERTWGEQFCYRISRLPLHPCYGWGLAFNDSHEFRMQSGEHPAFNPMRRFVDETGTAQA